MKSEQELADYYRAHKDDPELWGEGEASDGSYGRAQVAATITVTFSPQEVATIRRLAKEHGCSYAEVVRKAVRTYT